MFKHLNSYKHILLQFRRKAVLGSDQLKSEFLNKVTTFLHKSQVIYMLKNDSKKSKNLNETIANMTSEMTKFKETNKQSTESFNALEKELSGMQAASEEERLRLVKQIMELERSIYEQNEKKGGWVRNLFK